MKKDKIVKIDLIGTDIMRTATTVQHLAIQCHYSERAKVIGKLDAERKPAHACRAGYQ